MEEILASIRKAIDEDTRFGAGEGVPGAAPSARRGEVSGAGLVDEVLGLARGAGRAAQRPEAPRRSSPHVSLVSDDGASVLRPAFGQSRDEVVPLAETTAADVPAAEMLAAMEPVAEGAVSVGVHVGVHEGQAEIGETDMAMEQTRYDLRHTGERHLDASVVEEWAAVEEPSVRVADVETVVNAAFGKLAEQLTESRRRATPTLEDLAKELMRPVIKQWLDDNLSSIVERMVQAEIERVTHRSGL